MQIRSFSGLMILAALALLGCNKTQETGNSTTPPATNTPAPTATPAATPATQNGTTSGTAQAPAGNGELDSALVAKGAMLFKKVGCAECHLPDKKALTGADLRGLYGTKVELDDGTTVVADDAYLHESILEPRAKIVKGYQPVMPEIGAQLEDAQVDALVAYIKSLGGEKKGPGHP